MTMCQMPVVSQFEIDFFLWGPRFLGADARASINPTIHAVSCNVSETPTAIAGVIFVITHPLLRGLLISESMREWIEIPLNG